MTITNGYCTLPEFKAYITARGQTLATDATDDSVIEALIEKVSRDIDQESQRTYYARTETHYFDVPEDSQTELELGDDLLTVTTLTNGDDTVITSSYYTLYPLNAGRYRTLKLKQSSGYIWLSDSNGDTDGVISIAGTWGFYAIVPDNINGLCKAVVRKEYMRYGPGESGVAPVTAAGVVITEHSRQMIREAVRIDHKWL